MDSMGTLKSTEEMERYIRVTGLAMVLDFRKAQPRGLSCGYAPRDVPALPGSTHQGEILSPRAIHSRWRAQPTALYVAIVLSKAEAPPKTLLIIRGDMHEGKTVTAINTGIAFAQVGRKVLLVDADLRWSNAHEVLGIDNHVGVVEVLTGMRT
jgi:Mrp family chromosome partitioning ATPase